MFTVQDEIPVPNQGPNFRAPTSGTRDGRQAYLTFVDYPPLSDGLVTLRPWREDDAAWYVTAVADPEIQYWTSEPADISEDRVREAIVKQRDRADAVGFALCEAGTGAAMGNIGLVVGADGVGHAMYWLAAPARGRDLTSRALRLLMDWAIPRFDLSEVRLSVRAGNVASIRVAERAGFQRGPSYDERSAAKGEEWDIQYYIRRPESRITSD